MKGDFSKWDFDPRRNFNGVLHQQGRVLLDNDWNAQTRITNDWQDHAARELIGSAVAAVPAGAPDSFKVTHARVVAGKVEVTLQAGSLWADGLPVSLSEPPDPTAAVSRIATYLQPPLQDPPVVEGSITGGKRDAVILEVWREEVNAFQLPELLLEPALGGPDTTERVHTAMALRLYRLAAADSCSNLADKVKDDFSKKGKLKVSLQPTTTTGGDCPVVQGGGYVGFEHRLYRLEVARVNGGNLAFKWSQFNGGLVGRGEFKLDPAEGKKKVTIKANRQAIVTSGLTEFYLEALQYDPPVAGGVGVGHWKLICGARAALLDDHELVLTSPPLYGSFPADGAVLFFRLWDDLRYLADFPPVITPAPPKELKDGICLEFDPPVGANYVPGDYWVFSVRAGEIGNPQVLVDHQEPEGIHYHRVPLAILNWNNAKDITFALDQKTIEDCRHVFRPLTQQGVCCTFLVGDGVTSHGDFDSIEEALDHLPSTGGEICLLPGTNHQARVMVKGRKNITFRGCAQRTTVRPRELNKGIFYLEGCRHIILENLDLVSPTTAVEVYNSRDITIRDSRLQAVQHAVLVAGGLEVAICDNTIRMLDREDGDVAILMLGEDCVIERNDIRVVPEEAFKGVENIPVGEVPPPTDPCADVSEYYASSPLFLFFLVAVWGFPPTKYGYLPQKKIFKAPGGIQIASTSERIAIRHCHIAGGYSNGITLGALPQGLSPQVAKEMKAKAYMDTMSEGDWEHLREHFDSYLDDIVIEGNTIQDMGLNGIGSLGFFNLKKFPLLASVRNLMICGNCIERCLRQIPETPVEMRADMGFGGISLADVEEVVIRENCIEDNGVSLEAPVSGIFILHGEKIDISDNRILNNGPRKSATDFGARPGVRGGIVIALSFRRVWSELLQGKELLHRDGLPAVKIHHNIVSQPLGQSLFLIAMGPVSVVGNNLTSMGINLKINPISLLAANVLILNLGVSKDLLANPFFRYQGRTSLSPKGKAGATPGAAVAAVEGPTLPLFYLPNGNVLFANNQTTLDLREFKVDRPFSSQLIASLDDVSYSSNQSECAGLWNLLYTNTIILAVSIRTNDSRFQEGITIANLSLFSYGLMNTCTANQATHCLLALGYLRSKGANLVLWDLDYCKRLDELFHASLVAVSPKSVRA
jgi:hypothetical protein